MNNAPDTSLDRSVAAARLREDAGAGVDREELIRRMRGMGLNQIACIKLLREVLGFSLREAKMVVHHSAVWADRRESNDALHEAAFTAASEQPGYGKEGVR